MSEYTDQIYTTEFEIPIPKEGYVINHKIVAQRLINPRVKKIFDSADYYMEKEINKTNTATTTNRPDPNEQKQSTQSEYAKRCLISSTNGKKVIFDSADYFLAQAKLTQKRNQDSK